MKINKKHGIVFWITGLSGSGKTKMGNLILNEMNKQYGKTLIVHGDDIRNIYQFKQYKKSDRLKLGKSNSNFCKLITDQGVNVIFTTVALFQKLHKYNRTNLRNYLEIYIKSDIRKLLKEKKKNFYKKKTKFVWGLDIKPEFPKKPNILINNNFEVPIEKLGKILIDKIKKKLKLNKL